MPLPPSLKRRALEREILTFAAGDWQLEVIVDAIAASLKPSADPEPDVDDADPDLARALAALLEVNRVVLAAELIGLAFVACQGAIRRTYALVKAVRETSGTTEPPLPGLTKLLEQQLTAWGMELPIWHVGNYFKHRDEWPSDRTKLKKTEKPTWDAVCELGVDSASKTPMLDCLTAICGPGEPHDLVSQLHGHVSAWRHACANVCRSWLRSDV